MPVTTNTRKLAALLGASGGGIATDGTLTSTAIGEVIVAGDIAAGAVDTAELATDAVTTVKIANDQVTGAKIENNPTIAGNLTVSGNTTLTGDFVPSTPLSHRNMIINGAMQVAQRATSLSVSGGGLNGYWTCDRWGIGHYNTDNLVLTQEKSADAPDGFSSSWKHTVTTAESALAVDEYFRIYQSLEGQDLQQLAYGSSGAKSFTLSFWVKSSVTGTYGVTCYQYDGSLQQTHNYTITTADTWQKIELPFTGNTANAIANDNTDGLKFIWYLMVGDNFKGTASTTWSAYSGAKSAGLATAVWGTSTSHDFYLTGAQMEVGSNAAPFEHRSYGDDLARCQRYYTQVFIGIQAGKGNGSTGMGVSLSVPVSMRATPTVSLKSLSGLSRFNDSTTAVNTPTGIALSETDALNSTFYLNYSGLSGITDNRGWTLQSSDSVKFTAEL